MTAQDFRPTETEFQSLSNAAMFFARRSFDGTSKGIMPQLFVLSRGVSGRTGLTICGLAVDFNTTAEKDAALKQIAERLYSERVIPIAAALLSEAWMGTNLPQGVQPKDAITRKECAMVVMLTLDRKRCQGAMLEIFRNDDGIILPATHSLTRIEGKVSSGILERFFQFYANRALAPKGSS